MIIRKATRTDAKAIATCLLLAMEEIVYGFIGERNPQKALEFMEYFARKENNQYSYQNCWVAEAENQVVAAVNVYDGARLQELRQPVVEYVKSKLLHDFNPEDETDSGEFYIDTFGVQPDWQCRGIGSKLLQFVVEHYVTQQGKTLGLLVDKDNPNARKLYLKSGFKSTGYKVVFGKEMEHLQIQGQSAK